MERSKGMSGDVFQDIVARRTEEVGIKYLPDDSASGPSDHASFYRAGVPSLFFFTGVHEDYHQPTDDIEKINVEGAAEIVELVYKIASDIVNGSAAPVFAKVDTRAVIFRGQRGRGGGVVMGILPDMDDDPDQKGWRVAQVLPEGGAAKAGMLTGDSIIEIDGRVIKGFADYRAATEDKKPGDVLDMLVLRGDEEIRLKVELGAR